MKKVVRLTESDLHRIIKESVKNILKEYKPFEMSRDYVNHGNDNVKDRKGKAAMTAMGCQGEEAENFAKKDKGHGRYNKYEGDDE